MNNPRRTNSTRRGQITQWLRAQGRPCWICEAYGRPAAIDYSLPARHPLSFEVDELVPVSKGGDPYDKTNVAPAHRICNQRRGNKSVAWVLADAAKKRKSNVPRGDIAGSEADAWL